LVVFDPIFNVSLFDFHRSLFAKAKKRRIA